MNLMFYRRPLTTIVICSLIAFALLIPPTRTGAASPDSGTPAWAITVATNLLGPTPTGPSIHNPHPEVLTVDELAARVYQNALASAQLSKMGHGSLDPATGDIRDASGHPIGLNAASPPSSMSTGGVAPMTGCGGVDDPNATCHAYGGTAHEAWVNGSTCATSPTAYDGCMGETAGDAYAYYCGPGSSRVMASNWYGPPMYNQGESPSNVTSKGYAYYEYTNSGGPTSGTFSANMPGPINNDIMNHTGYNANVTSAVGFMRE